MVAGRPIRVEFLVQMQGHSDDDRDVSEDVNSEEELPDMYDYSDSDYKADPRSRLALPSQYERAKLQEENGEEDRFDSEGELSGGRSEESDSRELDSESEIQSAIEKSIPEGGSVAMFNKLSKMADEFMRTVEQSGELQRKAMLILCIFPCLIPESEPSILLHRGEGVKL